MLRVIERLDLALRRLDARYAHYFTNDELARYIRPLLRIAAVFPNPNLPEANTAGAMGGYTGLDSPPRDPGPPSVFRHRTPEGSVWFEAVLDGQYHEPRSTLVFARCISC